MENKRPRLSFDTQSKRDYSVQAAGFCGQFCIRIKVYY